MDLAVFLVKTQHAHETEARLRGSREELEDAAGIKSLAVKGGREIGQ